MLQEVQLITIYSLSLLEIDIMMFFLNMEKKNFTWSRNEATVDKALSLGRSTEDWKSVGNISSLTAMDFSNKELLSEGRNK